MTNPEVLRELVDDGSAATTSPLASIDSFLTDMLPAILVVSIIITVIFGVFAVVITISRIRSQIATVAMQKDIKAIRELLEKQSRSPRIDNIQVPHDTARENTASL